MKITVINLKQIIKYIFIFLLIIILLILIVKSNNSEKSISEKESKSTLIECLKYELPITKVIEEEVENKEQINLGIKILSMQISIFDNIIKKEEEISVLVEEAEIAEEEENEDITISTEQLETTVISEQNIKETYTDIYQNVEINNQTSFDVTSILENSSYTFANTQKVIIYHTHTCESYTPTETYNYTMTDSYRTTDLNYTVAKVGDELGSQLEKHGFTVIHDKTYHDYPSYTGSYGRSLTTLQSILAENSDAEIVIDLHRDAVGSMSNYAPCVQIGDEVCAQVMFVVGTNGSGLLHDNWRENLQYAIKVQQVANELYPGLFRPIILRNARYNQHLTTASTIIEVGATGNTLEQCIASMKYVAEILYKATQ